MSQLSVVVFSFSLLSTPSLGSFPYVAFKIVPKLVRLTMSHPRPFKEDRLTLPIYTPLFQAIDGVMSLALCPLVVPQALCKTTISVLSVPCCALHPFRVAKVTILKTEIGGSR